MELVNVYAERRQVYLTFDIKLWSLFSLLKFPQSDSEPKTGLWDVFWYSKLRKTQFSFFYIPEMKEKVELKPIPLRKEKRLSHSHLIRQKQLTNKGNLEFDWLCHSALL
jgi:hypothetical protein